MRDSSTEKAGFTGTVLKQRWELQECVGKGGVATVYAALDRTTGERVAVKVLQPMLVRQPEIRTRFVRESQAANGVGHPSVVRIIDADEDANLTFIVMELLLGELVEEWRMRVGGRMPLQDALDVADQVLEVLACAHEKGIVHRDIKPENLFRLHDGTIKVLDFGIARVKETARTEMTKTGALLGTPEFMPPEQAMGKRGHVDAQSDVWAVGATLFVLLSGEDVHIAANIGQVLIAAVSKPARSVGTAAKDLPRAVVEVIDKALAFEKGARWKTATDMRNALVLAAERSAIPTLRKTRAAVPVPVSTKRSLSDAPKESTKASKAPSVAPPPASTERESAPQISSEPTTRRPLPSRPPSAPRVSRAPDTLDEKTISTSRTPVQRPRARSSGNLPSSLRDDLAKMPVSDEAPTLTDGEMKRVLQVAATKRSGPPPPLPDSAPVDPFEITSAAANYPASVLKTAPHAQVRRVVEEPARVSERPSVSRKTEPVPFPPVMPSSVPPPPPPDSGPAIPPPPTPRLAAPPLNPQIMASMSATQQVPPGGIPLARTFPPVTDRGAEAAEQRRLTIFAAVFVIVVGGLGLALIVHAMSGSRAPQTHTAPAP